MTIFRKVSLKHLLLILTTEILPVCHEALCFEAQEVPRATVDQCESQLGCSAYLIGHRVQTNALIATQYIWNTHSHCDSL